MVQVILKCYLYIPSENDDNEDEEKPQVWRIEMWIDLIIFSLCSNIQIKGVFMQNEIENIMIGQPYTNKINWRSVPRSVPPLLFGSVPVLPAMFKNKNKKHYNSNSNGVRVRPIINNPKTAVFTTSTLDNRIVLTTDGGKIKYCPGNKCRVLLPLFQFGYNCNMPDGMDTYCIECNQRKRSEREEKRQMLKMGMYSIDAYEEYKLKQGVIGSTSNAFPFRSNKNNGDYCVLKRDIVRSIDDTLTEAKMKHRFDIPFSAESVYDKLFAGRRLICNITGTIMTPSCFDDHHEINIIKINDTIEVKCSHCTTP